MNLGDHFMYMCNISYREPFMISFDKLVSSIAFSPGENI